MATVKLPTDADIEAALLKVRKKLKGHWMKIGFRGLAEDLAQEGSRHAFEKRRFWNPIRGNLDTFFYAAGLNAGLSLLRKEAKEQRGKDRIQQAAESHLFFKMDGVRRRKRTKSDEPIVL